MLETLNAHRETEATGGLRCRCPGLFFEGPGPVPVSLCSEPCGHSSRSATKQGHRPQGSQLCFWSPKTKDRGFESFLLQKQRLVVVPGPRPVPVTSRKSLVTWVQGPAEPRGAEGDTAVPLRLRTPLRQRGNPHSAGCTDRVRTLPGSPLKEAHTLAAIRVPLTRPPRSSRWSLFRHLRPPPDNERALDFRDASGTGYSVRGRGGSTRRPLCQGAHQMLTNSFPCVTEMPGERVSIK